MILKKTKNNGEKKHIKVEIVTKWEEKQFQIEIFQEVATD